MAASSGPRPFLTAARRAASGTLVGHTAATVPAATRELIDVMPDQYADVLARLAAWIERVAALPAEARNAPVPPDRAPAEGCDNPNLFVRLMMFYAVSPLVPGAKDRATAFDLWVGHCAERLLAAASRQNASVLVDGYVRGTAQDVEKLAHHYCLVDNLHALVLDEAGTAGAAFESFCLAAAVRAGLEIGADARYRLSRLSLLNALLRSWNPVHPGRAPAAEQERIQRHLSDCTAWLAEHGRGQGLISMFEKGDDLRTSYILSEGHFAIRGTHQQQRQLHSVDPVGYFSEEDDKIAWVNARITEVQKRPSDDAAWNALSATTKAFWHLRALAIAVSEFTAAAGRVAGKTHSTTHVPFLRDSVIQMMDLDERFADMLREDNPYLRAPPVIAQVGRRFLVFDGAKRYVADSVALAFACFIFIVETRHGWRLRPGQPLALPWASE